MAGFCLKWVEEFSNQDLKLSFLLKSSHHVNKATIKVCKNVATFKLFMYLMTHFVAAVRVLKKKTPHTLKCFFGLKERYIQLS